MKCPTCGAENDPANRFCDQCGTRLDEAPAVAAPAVAPAPASTAAATTCPTCGAAVLPGQAFCEECGSPLAAAPVVDASAQVPATPAASEAPTITAPVAAADEVPVASAPQSSAPAADETVVCPACGHRNLAGDSYCENCGASLVNATAAAQAEAAPAADLTAPPAVATDNGVGETQSVPPAADELPVAANETPQAVPVEIPVEAAPVAEAPVEVPPVAEAAPVAVDAPVVVPAETPAEAPIEAAPTVSNDAERARLEGEIAQQAQIIAQFEQMQTMFGANVPPAVAQGLSDAQAAKAQAEAELAALATPAAPAVDPAEVARLEEEIARQAQIIAQFEQMQTMFGANVPPAVAQGLSDAQAAKAQAEAELSTLTGGTAIPAAVVPVAAAPAEQAPVSAPAETPAAQPRGARLVVESSGDEIALPLHTSEIIIGRQDPISGIFPEVDLTPYGGESGGVSRQHAKLLNSNGQWSVVDLNSTNYTRVNGSKLDPNTPSPISDGARLQLGRVVMVFHA